MCNSQGLIQRGIRFLGPVNYDFHVSFVAYHQTYRKTVNGLLRENGLQDQVDANFVGSGIKLIIESVFFSFDLLEALVSISIGSKLAIYLMHRL